MPEEEKATFEGQGPPTAGNDPRIWAILPVRILSLAAAAVGGYLAWASFGGAMFVGCGAPADCLQVLRGRWAYWLGIPVSIPAVTVYIAVLCATFWIQRPGPEHTKRLAW